MACSVTTTAAAATATTTTNLWSLVVKLSPYPYLSPSQSPAVSRRHSYTSHEPHDPDDQNFTPFSSQRQQPEQASSQSQNQSRPQSSSNSSHHTLRRTPRLEEQRSRRTRSVSVDSAQRVGRPPAVTSAPPPQRLRLALSDDLDVASSTAPSIGRQLLSPPPFADQLRRATHISRGRASAILYALEEGIRKPLQLTPDLVEEFASMSDLLAGQVTNPPGGNGRGRNNGGSRTTEPNPAAQYPAGGVIGPREVMRNRQAREQKRREESEQRERERAQLEEDDQRRAQDDQDRERDQDRRRRASAAGVADIGGEGSNYRRASGTGAATSSQGADRKSGGDRLAAGGSGRAQTSGRERVTSSSNTRQGGGTSGPGGIRAVTAAQNPQRAELLAAQSQPRTAAAQGTSTASQQPRTGSQAGPTRPVTGTRTSQAQAGASAAPSASQPPQTGQSADASKQRNSNVSSFPHAFERWETLSSHWEGLTSYWIRRLEQNSDENGREPLAQQMSRQITDLSAAGANLFHAVVELQRLRASSERKFQRWFLDTRQEQERARELQAEKDAALARERSQRAEALARSDRERLLAEKQVAEMKRELQISKEEARRAWEELGRREQEERERTMSLRDGLPTLVGGVQVVPLQGGGPSRHGSIANPTTRDAGPYPGAPAATSVGIHDEPGPSPADSPDIPHAGQRSEDPFLEATRPRTARTDGADPQLQQTPTTNGAAADSRTRASFDPVIPPLAPHPPSGRSDIPPHDPQASNPASAPFYHHQGSSIQGPGAPAGLEGGSDDATLSDEEQEYELDAEGRVRFDSQGHPIMYRPEPGQGSAGDDYDYGQGGQNRRTTSGGGRVTGTGWSSGPPDHPDYTGSGYGSGWESIPTHHHPTRLSDVLEEDERSRTSPSRASQNSRR